MRLNNSNVIFNQEAHTYTLDGVCLKGITGVLSKHLFPKKYDNIPEYILRNAAERGHFIHECCELADGLGVIPDCEEARNYVELKKQHNLTTAANEYIVTDGEHYASPIDIVFVGETENTAILADIKTTYTVDREYLSWQLSIYAYLFELQNPHIKVSTLYGIWLRGAKNELIPVNRKPDEVIKELLRVDAAGEEFINPYQLVPKSDALAKAHEVESYISELDATIKGLSEEKDKILSGLLDLMNEHDVDNWKGEKIQLIRKKPSIRESLDSKALKEKHPDIYIDFVKTSKVKGSITLKIL